jgi:hypothetical protein
MEQPRIVGLFEDVKRTAPPQYRHIATSFELSWM